MIISHGHLAVTAPWEGKSTECKEFNKNINCQSYCCTRPTRTRSIQPLYSENLERLRKVSQPFYLSTEGTRIQLNQQ